MKPAVFFHAVVFTVLMIFHASADITGKVIDENSQPVKDAQIRLLGKDLTAVSDDNGEFNIPFTGVEPVSFMQSTEASFKIRNDKLILSLPADERDVSITVHTLNGRTVRNCFFNRLYAGKHSISLSDIMHAAPAEQASVITVAIGMVEKSILIQMGECTSEMHLDACSRKVKRHSGFLKTAETVDTIHISKKGFISEKIAVESYEENTGAMTIRDIDGKMKFIPAKDSTFVMGQDDEYVSKYEKHAHDVSFTRDFYMDSTEVTQSDYETLMGEGPWKTCTRSLVKDECGVGPEKAVWFVNWYSAALYCNKRSLRDSLDTVYVYSRIHTVDGSTNIEMEGVEIHYERCGYRLPTEAEWEYACRAGTQTNFYWNDMMTEDYPETSEDSAKVNSYAVYTGNSFKLEFGHPDYGVNDVAKRLPNNFGLYDMSGNVREWCNDWHKQPYEAESVVDPAGPASGSNKITRGGSWYDKIDYCRVERRGTAQIQSWEIDRGFRVVVSVD